MAYIFYSGMKSFFNAAENSNNTTKNCLRKKKKEIKKILAWNWILQRLLFAVLEFKKKIKKKLYSYLKSNYTR